MSIKCEVCSTFVAFFFVPNKSNHRLITRKIEFSFNTSVAMIIFYKTITEWFGIWSLFYSISIYSIRCQLSSGTVVMHNTLLLFLVIMAFYSWKIVIHLLSMMWEYNKHKLNYIKIKLNYDLRTKDLESMLSINKFI